MYITKQNVMSKIEITIQIQMQPQSYQLFLVKFILEHVSALKASKGTHVVNSNLEFIGIISDE